MKDAEQKERLYKHFRALGFYALVEIPVYYRSGLGKSPKYITDIDVLGIQPTLDLRWEYVIGDCKTKKDESPVNRVLWAHGLMQQLSASRGIVILKRERGRAIEDDHKLFANTHRISLIDEAEFEQYDRAILFPHGSLNFAETAFQLSKIREELPRRYTRLTNYLSYLNGPAWTEGDHMTLLRRVLGKALEIRGELDPAKDEHLSLVLESAGVFAVALASCVGAIFHQTLQPERAETLDYLLKALIWGGREQYDHLSSLRKRLLEANQGGLDDTDLCLPEWGSFLNLVRTMLDAPRLAFEVPQVLRTAAIDLIEGRPFLSTLLSIYDNPSNQIMMLVKFSMLTAIYFAQATQLPPEGKYRIKEIFLKRQSALLARNSDSSLTAAQPAIPYASSSVSASAPDSSTASSVIKEDKSTSSKKPREGIVSDSETHSPRSSKRKTKSVETSEQQNPLPGMSSSRKTG